ncbi:MAG TPA: hybrid sensor histidine kinase/response regulator [Amaricoccus sp.]|nr:hybrid sensor histidine kinase/response regulator [Amaricoccus sp.]
MQTKRFSPSASGPASAVRSEAVLEREQAVLRLMISGGAACYILVAIWAGWLNGRAAAFLLAAIGIHFLTAVPLCVHILLRPGVVPLRRLLAMASDYLGITAVLVLGSEVALPIFAALIWVTVGYGMRYGVRYLRHATVAAVAVVVVTTLASPYWQSQPFLVGTFALTVLAVPAYAHVLLAETRRAHEAALMADRAKSRFLAQASHDLRQPVHAIALFTNCLRDARLGPDESRMVDHIDRALRSVSRLFRSLFDVSTLDSGRVRPRSEAFALGLVMAEVVAQNSEAAREAGVEMRLAPTRLRVDGDPGLIATVLQNLVSNAIKYAPGGTLLVGCRRRGGRVALEVHDRGPGIAPEHLPHVCDEFYRVSRAGHDPDGVGLGLSIVRRMAGLMGLELVVRSERGRGTVIAVEGLPVADAAAAMLVGERPRATPLSGLRVLLIEDDAAVREATAALLLRWGCIVEAPAAPPAEPGGTDVIIADYDLGRAETGLEVIDRLRQGAPLPAILISGHEGIAGVPGDVPVLAKPVRPAELRAVITAQWLDRSLPD